MKQAERLQIAVESLTEIMEAGCACSMDYGSSCDCDARDRAQQALQQICKHPHQLGTETPELGKRVSCADCHALLSDS